MISPLAISLCVYAVDKGVEDRGIRGDWVQITVKNKSLKLNKKKLIKNKWKSIEDEKI